MTFAEVLVIGGGVSGILSAIAASRKGERPLILEKSDSIGKRLLATGNGRCNLMNLTAPKYYGEPEFAAAVLGEDPVQELTDFWHSLGLFLRYDAEGRGYPCTFQASSVLDVLKSELSRNKVQTLVSRKVCGFQKAADGSFHIVTDSGERFESPRVIISTGGLAQPKLGGNNDAWSWLKKLEHSFQPPQPSLTPLITDRKSVSGLAGIRVKCRIGLFTGGQMVHMEDGELLFTENGVSGICVMQCSRFVEEGKSELRVSLFPDLFSDASLTNELKERRSRLSFSSPPDLLQGLCAPRLAYAVCKQAGIPLRGERSGELSDLQLQRIAYAAQNYRIQVLGREGFERAQVMAGGLICREVNPMNMESLLNPGLHITGELLNVDGACVGYNLMFACMSGLRAGANHKGKAMA